MRGLTEEVQRRGNPRRGKKLIKKLIVVVYFHQLLGAACTQKPEINKNCLKMNKTTCFCPLLKAGWLPEGEPRSCLFGLIFYWKRFKINKKGWKRRKKSISTSFWVRAALESWSKYTTYSRLETGLNHSCIFFQDAADGHGGHGDSKYSSVAATPPPISSSSITPLLEAIVKLKNNQVIQTSIYHAWDKGRFTDRTKISLHVNLW